MMKQRRLTSAILNSGLLPNPQQLATGIRLVIGLVFAGAGLLKLANQNDFIKALESYELFPAPSIEWLALLVPTTEVVLGGAFAAGVRPRLISWALIGLLAAFTIAGAIVVAQGRAIDCGCFGTSGEAQQLGATFFFRNAMLILSCLSVERISRKESQWRAAAWPSAHSSDCLHTGRHEPSLEKTAKGEKIHEKPEEMDENLADYCCHFHGAGVHQFDLGAEGER